MNDKERIEYFMAEIARLSNQVVDLQNERDALSAQVGDAFGDGYYDGFLDGAKHHEQTDCNTNPCYLGDDAMRCSEIAEGEKLNRLGASKKQQHLAEIRTVAGEIGYYNGFKDALVIDPPLPPATGTPTTIDIFAYRVEQASRYAASQYAAKVRQGGE